MEAKAEIVHPWPVRLMLIAEAHAGFVPYGEAAAAGLSIAWLTSLTKRGLLEHRSHGLYRVPEWPVDEYDEMREAVLWARGRAVVGGEASLYLWGLGESVPRYIDLLLDPGYRPRKAVPTAYRLRRRPRRSTDVCTRHGVATLDVHDAIADAIDCGVGSRVVFSAITQAEAREFVNRRTAARLLVALDARES